STSTGPSQVPYPAGTPPPTRSRYGCAISRRTTASRPTARWPTSTSTAGVSRSSCNLSSPSGPADRPQAGTQLIQDRPDNGVGSMAAGDRLITIPTGGTLTSAPADV